MRAEHPDPDIHELEVEVPAMVQGCQAEGWKVHEATRAFACTIKRYHMYVGDQIPR